MPHIASTLTSDTRYTDWTRNADGRLIEGHSVTVKGGFGLANKQFVTPQGAILTPVSDADVEFLERHSHFQEHAKAGFVKVIAKGKPEGEVAAHNMKLGDASQPMNPQMFKEGAKDDPTVLRVNTQVKV